MTHRERVAAVLHYKAYDRLPLVSFGYWSKTVKRWAGEGYIKQEDAQDFCASGDNGTGDRHIMDTAGFDFNWNCTFSGDTNLSPMFPAKVLCVEADGSEVYQDGWGHIQKRKPGVVSIPTEVGTMLKNRDIWEKEYLPKLQYAQSRIDPKALKEHGEVCARKGLPVAVHCGSLMGRVRNMLGVMEMSYMMADDEDLFREIVDTMANLCYQVLENTLMYGLPFDYAHFWEDICFKNGPLLSPALFDTLVGHHYKRITALLLTYGVDIVSLDCDGKIDALIPTWLQNGVNTMFPIEVGTWNASIAPWREQYGRALRGVGGMDKRIFAQDKAAVDSEIERLRPLVDLGGFIPCPDHRIAPDAQFPLVVYYCQQFRKAFG